MVAHSARRERLSAMVVNVADTHVEAAGLQDLRDRLKSVAERYRKGVDQLAGAAVKHDALLREVKENEEHYLLYSRKQEEARVAESMAGERISNVTVAESPAVPAQPTAPDLPKTLLICLLISLGCGATVVLTIEFLSPSALLTYAAYTAIRQTAGP